VVQQLDQYLIEVQHTSANMAPTNATSFWKPK